MAFSSYNGIGSNRVSKTPPYARKMVAKSPIAI
jgi:hypothetical protein